MSSSRSLAVKARNIIQIFADYGMHLRGKDKQFYLNHFMDENLQTHCVLCLQHKGEEAECGEFIFHPKSGISVHYFCLLFASGLSQGCSDFQCDLRASSNAVYGFKIEDILTESRRCMKLSCSYCRKNGAIIGCSSTRCKTKCHYSCGMKRNFLFQYFDLFASYCKIHRPSQSHEIASVEEISNKICGICFDDLALCTAVDILWSPCCQNTPFHRQCIEKQAQSSGRYYFRCPVCNNQHDYTNEMLRMGIYIPERDASWETPDAFSDLLDHHRQCDMKVCGCKNGRRYNKSGTVWEITSCLLCGLSGSHVSCGKLKTLNSPYVCMICCSVWGDNETRKKISEMGFNMNDIVIQQCEDTPENGNNTEAKIKEILVPRRRKPVTQKRKRSFVNGSAIITRQRRKSMRTSNF